MDHQADYERAMNDIIADARLILDMARATGSHSEVGIHALIATGRVHELLTKARRARKARTDQPD